MEIYLIRHTKPKIKKGICYGQTDLDLASTFELESNNILKQLGNFRNNAVVYSSPLKRCLKLAQKIKTESLITDDRLLEINFGDWEMQTWDYVYQNDKNNWMNDFVNVSCPNGESFKMLHERTTDFFKELRNKDLTKIIIVSHGGVIRSLLSHVNEEALEKSFDRSVSYGAIFKLNFQ